MTIENTETQLTAADEFAIQTTTNELIRKAASKNGMRFEDVPVEAREDALRYATNAFREEQAVKANPLYAQLQAEREAHKLTQAQLQAVKQTRVTAANNVTPVADVARVRGLMGERDWHALTDNGRLQSCGIDPASVTAVERQQCKELFGRGCDSHHANDTFKADAGRYRHLKNIAIILNLQGK